jgi:hypothetical protein
MTKPYYLLCEWDNDRKQWTPQFGDYSCATVRYEQAESYPFKVCRIVKLADDRQATADVAVEALNALYPHLA